MMGANAAPAPSRAARLEIIAFGAILLSAALFFLWTAISGPYPLTAERSDQDLYNRLADAFLAGQVSLLETPSPELLQLANPHDPTANAPYRKFHDITLYRGRYYAYFGPVPALVLLVPWKWITGASLPQNVAVAVFAWGVAAIAASLLLVIRRRYLPSASCGAFVAAIAAMAFGSFLPVLLRRPLFYELAIASAAFFALAGALCTWRAVCVRPSWAWALAGGACLGLAVGSRPNYILGTGAVIVVAAWLGREGGRFRWRLLLPLTAPWAACIAALLWYNVVRFGQPLEFGTSYMLAGAPQPGFSMFGLRYVALNAYYYLYAAPHFIRYFPFVDITGPAPWRVAGYAGVENMFGLLWAAPAVLLAAVAVWPGWRRRIPVELRGLTALLGAFTLANWSLLLLLNGASIRYFVDFAPAAAVVGGIVVLGLTGGGTPVRTAALVLVLSWTVVLNLLVSFQHQELWRRFNPQTYAPVARFANALTTPGPDDHGALRLIVRFPTGRTGTTEPLVVTGYGARADYVYVVYVDERHIRLGFAHPPYDGTLSPPIPIDFQRSHRLEVKLGSLYPPREHPMFDRLTAGEAEQRQRTAEVRIDDRVAFSGRSGFYTSSPRDVAVGLNRHDATFGLRFTGSIESVARFDLLSK